MPKSVVSKIRKAAQSVPSLQKWLLESAEAENWHCLNDLHMEAVYCIFRRSVCAYVGETSNIVKRLKGHGVYKKGDVAYYLLLPHSEQTERKTVEQELAVLLKPTVRNNTRTT